VAGAAHLFQGRVEEAGRLLHEGEVRLGSSGAQFGIEWLVWIRGLQLEMAEGPDAAVPVLLAGWEAAQGLQAGAALSLFGPDLVRLLVALDRVEEARSVLDALSAGESAGERYAVDVLVLRCRGLVEGDEAPIAEARAAHEAQGRRLEAALDDEARLLVRLRRDGKAAAADVRAGAEQAEAAGFGLLAARLRSVGGLEPDRRTARPAHGWDALTPSEWKIARLVGEGRSNPEIATHLVLSRRTVESHLSRIFTKLAVVNRTELALQLRDRELA
jgi:DNA-binding NarL/FixJ family response regulator